MKRDRDKGRYWDMNLIRIHYTHVWNYQFKFEKRLFTCLFIVAKGYFLQTYILTRLPPLQLLPAPILRSFLPNPLPLHFLLEKSRPPSDSNQMCQKKKKQYTIRQSKSPHVEGWMRQLDRKERVPRAGKRVRTNSAPMDRSRTKHQPNTHSIYS